jgi:EpsI family protein
MLRWSGSHAAVVVLFAGAAAVVHVLPRPALGGSDLAACPMEIAELRGRDVPLEEYVLDELAPNDMIYRTYTGATPGESVWLVVAYFENARYGAHDPKVCYVSQGWQIRDLDPVILRTRSGNEVAADMFSVRRRDEERLVMNWWYISDDEVTGDHRSFLNSMALQGILRGSNYGSFVRVSTRAEPTAEAALARLERFGSTVLTELPGLVGGRGKGAD